MSANLLGAILIRENTLLPASFTLETNVVFPGWKAVRNLDGYELGRQMQKACSSSFTASALARSAAVLAIFEQERPEKEANHRKKGSDAGEASKKFSPATGSH